MTFTYNTADLTTDLAKVRLELGDTDSTAPLFADEEVNVYLARHAGNVLLTAAALCMVLATKYARIVNTSMGGQSISGSDLARAYREQATSLRERAHAASGALGSVETTRIDGYSDDIDTRDTAIVARASFDVDSWEQDW